MSYMTLNPVDIHKKMIMNSLVEVGAGEDGSTEIKQGMSPGQIAEIVSDHLIDVVKQQFEKAKEQFEKRGEEK